MARLRDKNPGQTVFHQAVQEVVESVMPFVLDNQVYCDEKILERLTEPDRIIIFRVCWQDDNNETQVNRGYRVQFNDAIGPYKGGLRFHPNVRLATLKFLGFEQTFKNALTTLPMGGAKGGANFDPKGKSDAEIMRFCQAFMSELFRHIGPDTDVPAGDIGVGTREISFLFGQYKRLHARSHGSFTGKGLTYGGSLIRREATGYGCVYLAEEMMNKQGDSIEGKTCVVSGSGNVAQYTTEKINDLGGKVVTLSDSNGFIYDPDGIDPEKLAWVIDLKLNRRGRIREYAEHFGCEYHEGERPWNVPCDLAFPSATQNEIGGADAESLVNNGVIAVAEGANMPTTMEGVHHFLNEKILYAPGKAANAGGVAVSGLEQTQNAMRMSWSREEVDEKLKSIMKHIHNQCVEYGQNGGWVNYVKGANIAGFKKVADAAIAQGVW
jgi:glutamate dehydrogenase (NADP+)